MKKILLGVLDYVKIIFIALLITNVLNIFVFGISEVRQSSMEPNLVEGDQLIVDKLSYDFRNPKRGEVVVFIDELEVDMSIPARFVRLYDDVKSKYFATEGHLRLVKRIVGLPGDIIDIKDGKVFINGKIYEEPYLDIPTVGKKVKYPYKVEEGKYFCMGDNRVISFDSRSFGAVDRSKIEGRVVFRFWPVNKIGTIKNGL